MIMNERKGFTLIEILIVVAIIAILASIVLVGLGPTQQSGRDARRLSDLHEVQNALELYYNKCGYYPGTGTAGCGAVATGGYTDMATQVVALNIGVTSIPVDPTNSGTHKYSFRTDGASATTYVLATVLENKNTSIFNGYTPPSLVGLTSGDAITACGLANATYCISL